MHDRLTEGVGGNNIGSTTNDRTNYYEVVPSNYLESALWLESDRMGFLLDKLDEAKFKAQRDIVQNERRQGTDNQPYGRSFEILTTALYPESNPYSAPVVGYIADLQKAGVEDVKGFFRTYYAPSNATLTIAGDFDPAQVKPLVTKYFGDLKRGTPITRPKVAPVTLAAEKRLVFEDRVQVPRLYLQWPSVGDDNDDSYPLQFLGQILSGPRTARLTKALVYDTNDLAIRALSNKTIDSLVVDLPTADYITNVQVQNATIVGQFEGGTPEYFSAVLGKGSTLTPCVDAAIDSLTADGTLDKLASTWLPFQDSVPVIKP